MLTECALLAHAAAYLSAAPIGVMSLKGSGLGRRGETDMWCYLALLHIYHGTATVNDGIMEEGRGAEQMSCFPFRERARDETWARGGGGEW